MLEERQPYCGIWTGLAMLAALSVPVHARAAADDWGSLNLSLCSAGCETLLTISAALPAAVFVVGDIAYAASGRWVPVAFAITQISFAMTTGVLAGIGLASGPNTDSGLAALLGVDIALTVYGITSMLLRERPPARRETRERVQTFLAPIPGGLWTGLRAQL